MHINQEPLVSIIMPVFNAQDFIAASIESVLKQTYAHWELIIVDDCSQDNTIQIVKNFQDADQRIQLLNLNENSGRPAVTRNHGLKAAKGQYAAFLDADDTWLSEKLERQVSFFKENPAVGLVFGDFQIISDDPRFDGKDIKPVENIDWNQSVYERLLKYDFMANSCVMINLPALRPEERRFDEDIKLAFIEDWDLWLRIAKNNLVGYIPYRLGAYRLHASNCSWNPERLDRALIVIDKHHAMGFIDEIIANRAKANFYFTVAWSIADRDSLKAGELFKAGLGLSQKFSKIYFVNLLGGWLVLFPALCRLIKRHSIDRKIGKLLMNHQDL